MRIKCRIRHVDNIDVAERKKLILDSGYCLPDGDYNLTIGQEYTVYGILFLQNSFKYYICKYTDDEYPVPVFPDFFEVTDYRFSRYWQLSDKLVKKHITYPLISFSEWTNDSKFHESLIDGDEDIQRLFFHYKELMDLEFMDSTEKKPVKVLDGNWFMCQECDYVWEDKHLLEMTRCPQCRKTYLTSTALS